MAYDPNIHHRRSIRLKGYDYSQEGMYFVTICVQNRDCLFGEIVANVGADLRVCPNDINENDQGEHIDSPLQIILNDAGKMVERWYFELENKFPDIKCGEFVVMPNHFHCIIENNGNGNIDKKSSITVGADLRVCPDTTGQPLMGEPFGEPFGEPLKGEPLKLMGEHIGSPLHQIVQWFKTMSTNEYIRGVKTLGWKRFNRKLWQRDYWEHIIRDQKSFETISEYIINNPQNWNTDKLKSS